ncbi:SLBB domain-containing protein [bacterium]|nr:SLBB domain-containing protein [bacterium]
MSLRIFMLMIVSVLFLHAEPSLAEVKEAVGQNPALLESPQAKAMMAEKGLTAEQVKQKISENNTTKETTKISSENAINEIDINSTSDELVTQEKEGDVINLVNPFLFQNNDELRKDLAKKQQDFTSVKLSRYSASFYANKNTIDSTSLPTPEDYVVTAGDTISVHVYGDRNKDYFLDVKNDGAVDLEFIGPLRIGGMKFIDAKEYLESHLKEHYKMSSFNISMQNYSTIQVTLIGEVKYPGLYNLSSFSTVKDLLIVAKGVRDNASVRDIVIKRNSKVIARLDFYDLLFDGKVSGSTILKHGDVVIINKADKLVSIDGYVSHAAIFELSEQENLDKLIEYAGGLEPNASSSNIKIDRYSDNSTFETFEVSFKDAKTFKMKNGDKVYIYPLDFTAASSVNVYGNVIRPGSYRIDGDKTLNDFFKKSLKDGLKKFFLPETYFEYGVIKRYTKELNYATQSFNISKVINNEETVELYPNDQIFIFSKNDIFSNSYVITKGSGLIKEGKLQYYSGITLQDAINASGIKGILDDKVRVTTFNTEDFMPKTTFYSLKKDGNILLSAYDELEVYNYYSTHILEPVSIKGEVVTPASVYYENGMSLNDLIVSAGGLNKTAYTKKLEIIRYYIDEAHNRQKSIMNINANETNFKEFMLQPYDEVTVFKIPKWNEKKEVVLKGEVRFPGTYTIEGTEPLSEVIKRAGGFTENAFLPGAVFTRESIRQNQVEQYNDALAKIKRELAIYNAMPANAKKSAAMGQSNGSLNEVIVEAQKYQPLGRVSIKLDDNLSTFEQSQFNIVLKDKDTLTIPSRIDTVTVFGEVFNPTSFVYDYTKDVDEYIAMASGYARSADTSNVYIIHADGTSEPISSGWLSSSVEVKKGDTIVVPLNIKEYDKLEVTDSVAKILASFALTIAAMNSLGVF